MATTVTPASGPMASGMLAEEGGGDNFYSSGVAIFICFCATVFSVAMAVWQIFMHLRNYTEPTYQRYIVRIIFMVPVYAVMSFLALLFYSAAIYFNTIRDVYEAWVIYNFLSLLLAWVGGPGAVVINLGGRMLKPSWGLMTCCLPPLPLDGRFIRRVKQGCLQFVILKPVLATTTLILYSKSKYSDGNFSPEQGYLYITLIYTISYSLALYALLLFYFACKDLLKPFKPVPKFVVIKSVVFATYWQGVMVFLLAKSGAISGEREAADFQNFLICLEMAAAAIAHLYAFPHKEYAEANVAAAGNPQGSLGLSDLHGSIRHALNFNDVVYDTVHQFAPTYHDYVLYSDGSQEAPRRYRTRTFVPTGQEMETLRKHNRMFGAGNKVDPSVLGDTSSNADSTSPLEKKRMEDMDEMDSLFWGSLEERDTFQPGSAATSGSKPGGSGVKGPAGKSSQFNSQYSPPTAYDLSPLDVPQMASISANLPPVPGGRRSAASSEADSRRPSNVESRRTSASAGDSAGEETRLTTTERRRSSNNMLLDEVDLLGENNLNTEGHIQR